MDVASAAPREGDAGATVAVVVEDCAPGRAVLGFDADGRPGGARTNSMFKDAGLG